MEMADLICADLTFEFDMIPDPNVNAAFAGQKRRSKTFNGLSDVISQMRTSTMRRRQAMAPVRTAG